jgi:hypothetical protein
MAQGSLSRFDEFNLQLYTGVHDFTSDTFSLRLIDSLPSASEVSPTPGDFTEVSGSGYTAGGQTVTFTITALGSGVYRFDHDAGDITWSQTGGGPTDIVAGILVNDTAGVCIGFIDFTTDNGTTPISLAAENITWRPEVVENEIFRLN